MAREMPLADSTTSEPTIVLVSSSPSHGPQSTSTAMASAAASSSASADGSLTPAPTASSSSVASASAANASTVEPPTALAGRNASGDTCSHYGSDKSRRCWKPRSCYDCLNVPIANPMAGESSRCMLRSTGVCDSMNQYDPNIDFRRNRSVDHLRARDYEDMVPSTNATYCQQGDIACSLCAKLSQQGGPRDNKTIQSLYISGQVSANGQVCFGHSGCICLAACEAPQTDTYDDCDDSRTTNIPTNDSFSAFLPLFVLLQIALLATIVYRHRSFGRRRNVGRAEPEGPYNNIDAISSPSNRLQLSGWLQMHRAMIEQERKGFRNANTSNSNSNNNATANAITRQGTGDVEPVPVPTGAANFTTTGTFLSVDAMLEQPPHRHSSDAINEMDEAISMPQRNSNDTIYEVDEAPSNSVVKEEKPDGIREHHGDQSTVEPLEEDNETEQDEELAQQHAHQQEEGDDAERIQEDLEEEKLAVKPDHTHDDHQQEAIQDAHRSSSAGRISDPSTPSLE